MNIIRIYKDNINNMNTMEKVKYEKIGLCGFNNMGNTCYMNSVIQLIIHSRIFINFLLCENNPYNDNDNSDSSFIDMVIKNENKAILLSQLKSP